MPDRYMADLADIMAGRPIPEEADPVEFLSDEFVALLKDYAELSAIRRTLGDRTAEPELTAAGATRRAGRGRG